MTLLDTPITEIISGPALAFPSAPAPGGKATPADEFYGAPHFVPVLPEIIAETVLERLGQRRHYGAEWFIGYCEYFTRRMHATDPQWRKWLSGKLKRTCPRDQLRVWIEHWAKAFLLNPSRFQQRTID